MRDNPRVIVLNRWARRYHINLKAVRPPFGYVQILPVLPATSEPLPQSRPTGDQFPVHQTAIQRPD